MYPISTSPKAFLDSWDDWGKAVTIAQLLSKTQIQCYCIMDSGYHAGGQTYKIKTEAEGKNINLHIWGKHEIENYAINPDVIFRFISVNHRKGIPSKEALTRMINAIAESLKDDAINSLAGEILQHSDRDIDFRVALKEAQMLIVQRWYSPLDVIPGGALFKKLSVWTQEEYGIGISAIQIVSYFYDYEIPVEIKKVISAIVEGDHFRNN